MQYHEVIEKVSAFCNDSSLDFQGRGVQIQNALEKCSEEEILDHIDYAGIIPECYGHDSTEEKVFAKYCDALLARALQCIGLDAHAIDERGDAADVVAKGKDYSIVGDAKAFRLSRTAKNQKDFKVEALNTWKKGANFACLVSPLYQYPNSNSQIYSQAARYHVVIMSYTHLAYLIRHKPTSPEALKEFWQITEGMKPSKSAQDYWTTLDSKLLQITGTTPKDWMNAIKSSSQRLPEQAKEHIEYWEEVKKGIADMPKAKLAEELINALKIDSKIDIIKKTAGM